MPSILKTIKLLSDPTRLRILLLLEREELSVAELQEILSTGQSSISTHLSQLRQAGLVEDRRTGKSVLYRLPGGLCPPASPRTSTANAESGPGSPAASDPHNGGFTEILSLARRAALEIPEAAQDVEALRLVLEKRQDKVRAYFDELAGKFGRQYVPGRSWKEIGRASCRGSV